MLQVDVTEAVLRPADLSPGFRLDLEYPVNSVETSHVHPGRAEPATRGAAGVGRHVVLVRANREAADGVVSVASSAVRYETTFAASGAFQRLVATAPSTQPHSTPLDAARFGDEVHSWRCRLFGSAVDEIVIRVRNYVLGLIVVLSPAPSGMGPAPQYARLLRAKLLT